jgi:hypothetical protein
MEKKLRDSALKTVINLISKKYISKKEMTTKDSLMRAGSFLGNDLVTKKYITLFLSRLKYFKGYEENIADFLGSIGIYSLEERITGKKAIDIKSNIIDYAISSQTVSFISNAMK